LDEVYNPIFFGLYPNLHVLPFDRERLISWRFRRWREGAAVFTAPYIIPRQHSSD
jgi:hypothetical protein